MDDKSTIVESKLMTNHLNAPTPSQTSVLVTSTSTIASSSARTATIPSPTNLNNGNSISHKIESLVQTSSQASSSSYFPSQTQPPMPNFNYNTNSNHFYPPNMMNYPQGPPLQQQQQHPAQPPGLAMPAASPNNYLFNANSTMMYAQTQAPNMFNPMSNGLNPSGMTYPSQMQGAPGMPPQSTTSNSSLAQALATPPALMMPHHQQVMNVASSHLAPSHSPVRHLSTSSTSSSASSPSHSSSSTKSTKLVNGNEETKKVIFSFSA